MSDVYNYQESRFKGLCIGVPAQEDYPIFLKMIKEVLPAYGCNALVLLIRYGYRFESHKEISDGWLGKEQAAELMQLCRENGIRLIPKMNLHGHQSGMERGTEQGLLRVFPEFDETPEADAVRYCRSLCPSHPKVSSVVFDLADELIDAFGADAIHIGLDEVFELGSCPRCKDIPNDILFADWVNTLYNHLAVEKKVEAFMWGDRFLDGVASGYGEWEASKNGTWPAIDKVPKDIVICDWHYEVREEYPSIDTFTQKGFPTIIGPWRNIEATKALLAYASTKQNKNLLGVLQTSWCHPGELARALCGVEGIEGVPQLVSESFKLVMKGL